MRKRRLKKWVKIVLAITIVVLLGLLFAKIVLDYEEFLRQCDLIKGYHCNIFGK